MDLTPTAEEATLRAEVRAWLQANLPWEYGKGLPPRFDDLAMLFPFLSSFAARSWQRRPHQSAGSLEPACHVARLGPAQ